jgi:signal transduction histidine kinase/CheY-like chemotaxis protein
MHENHEEVQNIDTKELTILFVEDDPSTIRGIQFMLDATFNKVFIAENGLDGYNQFVQYQDEIDVIVTDIRMPKMNGTEMIAKVKEINPHMPVLITTAFSDRDYLMKSIELGVNCYLVKPFKVPDLINKIKVAYFPVNQDKKFQDQYNLTKNILDAQSNFTILMDENLTLKMVNQTMLRFFGLPTLDAFLDKYDYLCDLFIEEDGFLIREQNDKKWVDIVLEDCKTINKVKLKGLDGFISTFQINIKEMIFQEKKHFVVVLNDITELEYLTEKKIFQEKLIAEHTKMAQMGSMIGSIAHQWRQPLSIVSSIASGVQLKLTIDDLKSPQLNEYMEKILETTSYLSETISVFRNFLKEKKEFKEVCIQDRLDIALNIVSITLKENQIELKKSINYNEPLMSKIVVGELVEVVINIINNAKDALFDTDKELSNPWIKLGLEKIGNSAHITIEDNAGGIPKDVLPKIFNEYFTTKDDDRGTGLGLSMSKNIIENSLKGKLYASNTDSGAKFTIELPLSK